VEKLTYHPLPSEEQVKQALCKGELSVQTTAIEHVQ